MKLKEQKIKYTIPLIVIAAIAFIILTGERIYNTQPSSGTLERIQIHSQYLENTITKESPDRLVSVYLPPSYKYSTRSYPVVYLLHGIAGTDQTWTNPWSNSTDLPTIQAIMDEGIETGKFGEMIIVMPDQKTNWFGSFYTSSEVTGDWESFTSKELVTYIDKNYRTIPKVKHRAVAGHSMGGYGAITLSMKYPEVFSSAYGLSSAFIDFAGGFSLESEAHKKAYSASSFKELGQSNDIHTMAVVTISQAFSPNPNNPPFYVDFPLKEENGKMVINEVGYKGWKEHSPIEMVKRYKKNLKKLNGIAFDAGDADEFPIVYINSRALSKELEKHGIDHTYDEYQGNHRDQLWGVSGRIYNNMLPYIWERIK